MMAWDWLWSLASRTWHGGVSSFDVNPVHPVVHPSCLHVGTIPYSLIHTPNSHQPYSIVSTRTIPYLPDLFDSSIELSHPNLPFSTLPCLPNIRKHNIRHTIYLQPNFTSPVLFSVFSSAYLGDQPELLDRPTGTLLRLSCYQLEAIFLTS
ncbi:hypothetical protein F4782DRAFT_57460 [Xylaria castorea]|nr:hypothetical protein F4782DRAFT_57460 [Xylaria castorea]